MLKLLELFSCKVITVVAGAVALLLAFITLAIKTYNCITLGICKSEKKMNGKTVIITGANSGIGYETALDIAKRGARVIMACRNLELAQKARDEIATKSKNDNVIVRQLDLSSLKSIRDFAREINTNETKLDVLIHNAGMASFDKKITSDGLERTMATNQFGPFLLTHLLIDLLRRSKPSRIVIVASELYRVANVNMENPNPLNGFTVYLYYVSKYANIMFTLELARRLEGSGVTANCLHPGMIDSGIWRSVPFPLNLPMKLVTKIFFKNPEQGAQTSIHLAVSDEVDGVNGKYFMDCREHTLSRGVSDMARARKYWDICEKLVQLKPDDPKI
uniref:Putative dehydrogenase with different specificities related to short-chain alcohol dehydrogenase n=1 Tax=Panstrongylus megistus TaxID=65343 RepID=A0A069DST5_9HEMI